MTLASATVHAVRWVLVVIAMVTVAFGDSPGDIMSGPSGSVPVLPSNETCTSLPSGSEYTQCGSVTCLHGNCSRMILGTLELTRCTCSAGWAGESCDQCCPLDCAQGECDVSPITGEPRCPMLPGAPTDIGDTSGCTDQRPAPVVCSERLTCVNGDCVTLMFGEICACDQGWNGPSCTECCEPNCDLFMGGGPGASIADPFGSAPVVLSNESCTSLPSGSEYTQCVNHTCLHGNCSRVILGQLDLSSCKCSTGWAGESCDQCCPLKCIHGECELHSITGEPHCKWDPVTTEPPVECLSVPRDEPPEMCSGIYCYHGECETIEVNDEHFVGTVGKCVCDLGWAGTNCDTCCELECLNGGLCQVSYPDDEMYCNCVSTNFTGPRCNETLPPGESPWVVIGVTALVIVILLVIFTVGFYWSWRRGDIPALKLVRKMTPYAVDDEGHMYDAFISYRSTREDQNFVVRQLMMNLERRMGFSTCFHARDFLPGITIAENILAAVQQSRRTILVISPSYCAETLGEWPRFEFETALSEMLKKRQLIIPIMFEQIDTSSTAMDPVLKNILDSMTYLEWPGQAADPDKVKNFWKRLYLMMPKKSSASAEKGEAQGTDEKQKGNPSKV